MVKRPSLRALTRPLSLSGRPARRPAAPFLLLLFAAVAAFVSSAPVIAEEGPEARFAAGLAAYRKGSFAEARRELETTLRVAPADPAAELLLERIAVLEREAPEAWDGIWSFETK